MAATGGTSPVSNDPDAACECRKCHSHIRKCGNCFLGGTPDFPRFGVDLDFGPGGNDGDCRVAHGVQWFRFRGAWFGADWFWGAKDTGSEIVRHIVSHPYACTLVLLMVTHLCLRCALQGLCWVGATHL